MNETYQKLLEEKEWKDRRLQILIRDNNRCVLCGSTDNLNVHHKYYVYGCLPWEYEDKALVSLCQDCHFNIHKISDIVCFSNNEKTTVMKYTPCHRCSGTGYLPVYNYYQNGICFRCQGRRFEELIDKKEKSPDDINSQQHSNLDFHIGTLGEKTQNIPDTLPPPMSILQLCEYIGNKKLEYAIANNVTLHLPMYNGDTQTGWFVIILSDLLSSKGYTIDKSFLKEHFKSLRVEFESRDRGTLYAEDLLSQIHDF